MDNKVIDISQQLNESREEDNRLHGVMHSKTYSAVQFIGNVTNEDSAVHIEIYEGSSCINTGLNISFGKESRMIMLTGKEAIKLAKDILSAT
ncbi:hypothetical protein SAMN06296273_0704 [Nitrosomonas ureae]|uniref:Uncharacterized protein n=1 Tax=Nitrosomonas ureae TaxID=44577 RepID=A0A285BWP8_9PROT|nr:hypothetical protein [Nitrosomonas ureae]SNX59263.1 hypothetical protein SAMN06296273_0704 [Nitrosomonas ureae]